MTDLDQLLNVELLGHDEIVVIDIVSRQFVLVVVSLVLDVLMDRSRPDPLLIKVLQAVDFFCLWGWVTESDSYWPISSDSRISN